MRTKRALPRIPRATDRNRSESAHPRRGTAKNARCDRHFWRRQLLRGFSVLKIQAVDIERPTANTDRYGLCRKTPSPPYVALSGAQLIAARDARSKNCLTLSELTLN